MLIQRRTPVPPLDIAPASPIEPATTPLPATEEAWRTLSLIVDWIKHAESKAAAALASAGLLAGLLYTVVNRVEKPGVLFTAVTVACAAAVTTAAVAAGSALFPRLHSRGAPTGLIFYRSITDRFGHDAGAYVTAYTALTADRSALFAALSAQIWANANVATRKYRALNVAVTVLMLALVLLATTALLSLLGR